MKTIARGSRISETCSSNVQSHANVFFYHLRFKTDGSILERGFANEKKHQLFTTVFTIIHWVTQDWLAEPMLFINLDLTDGALPGDAGKVG